MIALSTGSLHTYGLSRIFELAAQVGFDGIEIMIDRPDDNRNPAYLRRLSIEYALPIVALHSPFLDVPDWPHDQLGRLERTVALAQDLSVPVVVAHLPYRIYGLVCQWQGARPFRFYLPVFWPRREPYYHLLRHPDRLAQMEADAGVTIAVENMPARRFLGVSIPLYWFNRVDALSRFPHLTMDTTHIGTWGLDVLHTHDRLAGNIAHVHLSNYDGREHRPPPEGRLPLDALLHRLAGDAFQGAVSVECNPKAFHADDTAACRSALERTLAFCRKHYTTKPG